MLIGVNTKMGVTANISHHRYKSCALECVGAGGSWRNACFCGENCDISINSLRRRPPPRSPGWAEGGRGGGGDVYSLGFGIHVPPWLASFFFALTFNISQNEEYTYRCLIVTSSLGEDF